MNNSEIIELKSLNDRLQSAGFSWQNQDYLFLKEILPSILLVLDTEDWPRKIAQETGIPHGRLACPKCGAVIAGSIPEPICGLCEKPYWPEWSKDEKRLRPGK